jgi:hypothetical protein
MIKILLQTIACLITLSVIIGAGWPCAAASPRYVFAYFKDEAHYYQGLKKKTGGAGVYLAGSEDGLSWKELNGGRHAFKPTVSKILRDPFIAQGPDGVYHLVWTTAWDGNNIGYAESRDLLHWTGERIIPVMAHEPEVINTWAPEILYDPATARFLIFWSSSIPGRFPETDGAGEGKANHRLYYTATADFQTFIATKLFFDPGFSCIDADIVIDGPKYVMFLKNETRYPPAKYLIMAEAGRAEGPYTVVSPRLSPEDVWSEGPSAIKIGSQWFVYFDMYEIHKYGLIVSPDRQTWTDATDRLQLPSGAKHGNIFTTTLDLK